MIKPINFLINNTFESSLHKVDMLQNISLASVAAQLKYAITYKDFDVRFMETAKTTAFTITCSWLTKKCKLYNEQDVKAKRPINNNVSAKNLEQIRALFSKQNGCCSLCGNKFSSVDQITFDRIDNGKPHLLNNITLACNSCNIARGDSDFYDFRLATKLNKFADKNNYPFNPHIKKSIEQLQNGITGGLSNVLHRINIAGETHINKFYYKDKKVYSVDLPHIVSHITSVDFNSLYPSVYSSIENEMIKYTNHRLYMPGKIL
jgi:5-methylcytosine-specific restriction endonuclease McrA